MKYNDEVSTFAWFQASQTATVTASQTDPTGTFATKASATTLGSFLVEVTLGSPDKNTLALTDNLGATYMYKTGDTSTPIAASSNDKYAKIDVGIKVTYSGSLATADEINAVWVASATTAMAITVSDTSAAGYDALETPGTKIKVASGEGLKFRKDKAFDKSEDVDWAGETVSWPIPAATLQALSFTSGGNGATVSDDVGDLYIAVKGIAAAQNENTYYEVTVAID